MAWRERLGGCGAVRRGGRAAAADRATSTPAACGIAVDASPVTLAALLMAQPLAQRSAHEHLRAAHDIAVLRLVCRALAPSARLSKSGSADTLCWSARLLHAALRTDFGGRFTAASDGLACWDISSLPFVYIRRLWFASLSWRPSRMPTAHFYARCLTSVLCRRQRPLAGTSRSVNTAHQRSGAPHTA